MRRRPSDSSSLASDDSWEQQGQAGGRGSLASGLGGARGAVKYFIVKPSAGSLAALEAAMSHPKYVASCALCCALSTVRCTRVL